MLRKRTRSLQKDQHQMGDVNSDYYSQSHALRRNIKGNSIFNIPCVFVGLGPKVFIDSDSVRSPTSPLDSKVLSNLGNIPTIRSPRSLLHEGHQRSWDCCKVGLSIVESLEDCSKFSGKILPSLQRKKISLSPQMMIKTPMFPTCINDSIESSKSLPKDFCKVPYNQKGDSKSNVLFEIGETGFENEPFGKSRSCSLDSCSPLKIPSGILTASKSVSDTDIFSLKDVRFLGSSPSHFIGGSQNSSSFQPTEPESNSVFSVCSSNDFFKALSACEIELSEDYTCVISHGPNSKTTHFFGDLMLETHSDVFTENRLKNEKKDDDDKGMTLIGEKNRLQTPNQYPSSAFLSFCHHCNKKLDEGEDIYIYRGEKSFCSLTCRDMEIMIDEELEESNLPCENSPKLKLGEQIFETGIPTAT